MIRFRTYQKNYLRAMAKFFAELPDDLRSRVAFLQPGFGSTGDRQLYKGVPVNSQFLINSTQYFEYMKEMTVAFTEAFKSYPQTKNFIFLFNLDDCDGPNPAELKGVSDRRRGEMLYSEWMYKNFNCQLRKQQFNIAIGYMSNDEIQQDMDQRAQFYGTAPASRWGGQPDYVRGEHNDGKWSTTPMANASKPWHYYWTAISSVDKGLDAWETQLTPLMSGEFTPAYKFSYRYSYYKKPQTSPYAFIALRDVLDYSNIQRFPEMKYGKAEMNNTDRINKILQEYHAYGAVNDDTNAVTTLKGCDYLLNSKGLNDCVWKVIDRNYSRFITQVKPNETSVGYWRVGSMNEPYGRFARGFENASGKNSMYFKLSPEFFEGGALKGRYPIEIKVIYYDKGTGKWELQYDAVNNPRKTAFTVEKSNTGTWKEQVFTLKDANFGHKGPNESDFSLVNTDKEDDIFHLIEIARLRPDIK